MKIIISLVFGIGNNKVTTAVQKW